MPAALLVAVAVLMVGCGLTRVVEPDPAQIPDGPVEVMPGNPEPIGPITQVGQGRMSGFGWRYSVYSSADGLCTQLEMTTTSGSACGGAPPAGDETFGGIGFGESSGGPATVEGLVADGVEEVWLQLADGRRIQAMLLPLAPADLPGSAFVGVLPEGTDVASVVAIGAGGDDLGTYDLRP